MEKVTSKNSPFRLHSQGAHNLNKRQEEKAFIHIFCSETQGIKKKEFSILLM